jgi:hypothetical protein
LSLGFQALYMTHSEENQYHAMSGLPYQPEGMQLELA